MRATLRWLTWLVGGLCLVLLAGYALLWAFNARDEAPSATVLAFQRQFEQRPALADADNGYVYLLELDAPPKGDPQLLGSERMAFLLRHDAQADATSLAGFPPGAPAAQAVPVPPVPWARPCQRDIRQCAQALEAAPAADLARWLADQAPSLRRYQALLERPGWREQVSGDPAQPLPAYSAALHGQLLLLVTAWRQARAGDGAGAAALLQADLRFWRIVLRDADTLMSKMIAGAALRRHFALGNLVLRAGKLPAPDAWRAPFDTDALSLRRALGGELRHAQRAVDQSWAVAAATPASSPGDRLARALQRPFFKRQASLNLLAERIARVADASERPPEGGRMALLSLPADTGARGLARLYNPTGRILVAVGDPVLAYRSPLLRIGDLEGQRRAALAAADLRLAGVVVDAVPAALDAYALRDPQGGHALRWDAAHAAIGFDAQAEVEPERSRIVY